MSQDPNNPPQTNPVLRAYQDWSAKTTFVTRTSMIGIVIVYITSWVFNADMALSNIPYFTVDHFELYRLILSPLVGNSFITVRQLCCLISVAVVTDFTLSCFCRLYLSHYFFLSWEQRWN